LPPYVVRPPGCGLVPGVPVAVLQLVLKRKGQKLFLRNFSGTGLLPSGFLPSLSRFPSLFRGSRGGGLYSSGMRNDGGGGEERTDIPR